MRHFKGTFNWYGEVHTLSTVAYGEPSAYMKLTGALAKRVQRIPNTVRRYFGNAVDNYKIEEVKDECEE